MTAALDTPAATAKPTTGAYARALFAAAMFLAAHPDLPTPTQADVTVYDSTSPPLLRVSLHQGADQDATRRTVDAWAAAIGPDAIQETVDFPDASRPWTHHSTRGDVDGALHVDAHTCHYHDRTPAAR